MNKKIKLSGILFTIAIISLACSGGGSDRNDSLINGFGDELRESLPEVKPVVTKDSPSDVEYQDYDECQDYGGLFQRVLGDDPLSIFFMVDLMDQFISEILYEGNPDVTFGGSQSLTLPFFEDTINFENTFTLNNTHLSEIELTYGDQSETSPVYIEEFRGGYTDDSIAISCYINSPDFTEGRILYYAERNTQGRLNIKYATFFEEFHDDTESFYTTNRRHVSFIRDSEDSPYTYKSAGKTIQVDNNDTGVFSIIMGGITEEFIIRRRAYYNDGSEMFIDQLTATTYDESTHNVGASPLEEQYSTDAFDVDGEGFTDGGGLGNSITLTEADAVHLNIYADMVAADQMLDFSEIDDLPQTESDL